MSAARKTPVAVAAAIGFLGLGLAFMADPWGKVQPVPVNHPTAPVFTNTTTVRLSIKELAALGGDTTGADCQACHEGKPLEIKLDAKGRVIVNPAHQDLVFSRMNCIACHDASTKIELEWDDEGHAKVPPAHKGLEFAHGPNNRNDHCLNCHEQGNLRQLHSSTGKKLALEDSTQLCADCHGPTYRDWNAGIHGRTSGLWQTGAPDRLRKDCVSCHDPHRPAFPQLIPGPGPRLLHQTSAAAPLKHGGEHHE